MAWQIRWTVEAFLYHHVPEWPVHDHAGDQNEALRDLDN